jgi:predicted ATP-grasp superfamily ATP-dependent carboligase
LAVNGSTMPAGPTGRVLIGFAEALAAPEAAWSLVEAGLSVTTFARRGSRPSLRRSRSVELIEITPPELSADLAVEDLLAFLGDRGDSFTALMPLDDAAVWLCNEVQRHGALVRVAGPTGAGAELALDKRLQLDAARSAGFAVPPTTTVEAMHDLESLAEFPLVLKPALPVSVRDGKLTRGANHVCADRAELERAAGKWRASEPLLAQPLITGTGEGLFGLQGRTGSLALSAHHRLRMMNPQGSGSSACVSVAVDPELAGPAERMLAEAGWRGMFMLEFLRAPDGPAWFMELNGRPWGSMALARRLGLEYPAWAVAQLDNPELAPDAHPRAGQVCRHLGRELIHLMMVMRGPRSVALTNWPSRRRALADVLRIDKNDGWYNWRPGDRAVFIDDTIGTLRDHIPGLRRWR